MSRRSEGKTAHDLARLALSYAKDDAATDLAITRRNPTQHASRLVDRLFADRYGWPLNARERDERDALLLRVLDNIELQESR